MNTHYHYLLLGALLLANGSAYGDQQLVYGKVLKVEPLHAAVIAPACVDVSRPSRQAGLAALLTWDLIEQPAAQRQCRTEHNPSATGYRVTYEWDGHRFEDILPQDPGNRIPLRVEID